MKKKLLTLSYCILFASIALAQTTNGNATKFLKTNFVRKVSSSTLGSGWSEPTGKANNMTIYATVYKNGVEYMPEGLELGVFYGVDNYVYGVSPWFDGGEGIGKLFLFGAQSDFTTQDGFFFKVYDPTNNKFYSIDIPTVNDDGVANDDKFIFVSDGELAAFDNLAVLSLKFDIAATSANISKGTVSGSVGTFTSGQSVSLTATPLAGYRFVNWTDGVGGNVMSTNAAYTFSANESRNLIANFELSPITSTIAISSITNPSNTDVVVDSDGKITVDANTTLKSVTLNNAGKLDLPSGRTLAVSGNLVLKSGSRFVDLNPVGGLTVTGTTTIQQDLTGAGGATPSGRFWYVGTPVTGATSAVFNAAGANQLWYYNEPTHDYVEINNNTTPLEVGRGYVVRLGADATVSFTGSLVSGNKTFNLTNTAGHAKSGFNLIYNPYPSFMLWHDAGSLPGEVMPSIWTRSVTAGGTMAFDSYNVTLGQGTSGSGTTVTRYIAPYQAFWVKASANSTVSIANSMRTFSDVDAPTNGLRAKAVSSTQLLRLRVSDGIEGDETLIAIHPSATNSSDTYDTPKMSNDISKIPEIFTTIGSDKYAINTFYGVNSLNLGFATEKASTYTIKATEISNFSSDIDVVLVDNSSTPKTETVLTEESAGYEFSSDVANSNTRFTVEFRVKGETTAVEAASKNLPYTLVRNSNDVYELNIMNNKTANVKVFNTLGQLIQNFDNVSVKSIGGNLSAGVYTVVVKIDGLQPVSKKLSIR